MLKVWQIFVLIGTVVFFFSALLPMFSVQFIWTFSISLLDIYGWIGRGPPVNEATSEWIQAFSSVGLGLLLTAILFPLTIVVALVSLRIGPKLCLIAGFLGISCWLSSVLSVVQLKSLMAQSGGPFGALAASFIQIGYGVYVGILGSMLLIASYIVGRSEIRKLQPAAGPQRQSRD